MKVVRLHARVRWATIGALCAVVAGGGGLMSASASVGSGEKAIFVPITPCRVMDTRIAPFTVGARSNPIGSGETHSISVRGSNGNCTIPTDATGLAMNVTAVNGTDASYLTVFPSGVTQPVASNLNWSAGEAAVPNAVNASIGGDGKVSFFNNAGNVDVVADIVGYYVDHNHDDRYYAKGEIDTQLAAKADKPTGSGALTLGPSAFVPSNGNVAYTYDGITFLNTAGGCFSAPVQIPDGATITQLRGHIADFDAAVITSVDLRRDPIGSAAAAVIASAGTTAAFATGNTEVVDSTVTTPVVDNASFTYFVMLCLFSGSQYFHDATVAYILP